MKSSYFFVISCCLLLLPARLYAQRVYHNNDGKVIMEFIPTADFQTDDKESSNTAIRLEVAQLDLGTDGFGKGEMVMDWTTADSICKRMHEEGIGWRMPTQQELVCIWLSQPKLDTFFHQINSNPHQTAMPFDTDNYWSSTEIGETSAHAVDFCTGGRGNYKSNKNRVRCVRETP